MKRIYSSKYTHTQTYIDIMKNDDDDDNNVIVAILSDEEESSFDAWSLLSLSLSFSPLSFKNADTHSHPTSCPPSDVVILFLSISS